MTRADQVEIRALVEQMLVDLEVAFELVNLEVDEDGCPWISNSDESDVFVGAFGEIHAAGSLVPTHKYSCYVPLGTTNEAVAKAVVDCVKIPEGYSLKFKCGMGTSVYTTDENISVWMLGTLLGNKA